MALSYTLEEIEGYALKEQMMKQAPHNPLGL